MDTVKILSDEEGQFINLPEQYQFEGKEVYIYRVGSSIILSPSKNGWQPLFDSLDQFAPDFMAERQQPTRDQKTISLD